MKTVSTVLLTAAMFASSTAVAQQDYVMSCSDVITKLNREATPEAKARFADLRGSCLGVVDLGDNNRYMHTKMIVRRSTRSKVTLYLPATDRTFDVTPDASARVLINGRKVRPRDLVRGQELDLYVSVDAFTREVIDEIALPTETEELVSSPAVLVPALPTTG